MKHAVLILLVLVAGIGAGALVFLYLPPSDRDNPDALPPGAGPIATGDWPIYRGDAGMMGVADGGLPDAIRVRWRFQTEFGTYSSPVIADGRVFFGSVDANVYCVSADTGRKIWSFAADEQVQAPPLYHEGRIYVGSDDRRFYCLDANSGRPLWQYEAEDRIVGSANLIADPDTGRPRVVVGSHDYNVYCLTLDGGLAWKASADNYINGGMAVAGGRIVFGSCDSSFHAFLTDGKAGGSVRTSAFVAVTPAFDGRRAYAGNYDGNVICADMIERKTVWRFKAPMEFDASPAVTDSLVLAGCSDGKLYCLDRETGKPRWHFRARDEVDCSPVVCGQRVLFGSADGKLYAAHLADGRLVWSYDVGGAITTSPALGAGILVVGCDDGYVYAFEAKR